MAEMAVMGVDGARGGWLAARLADPEGEPEIVMAERWDALPDADLVCVDMPIGLPDSGRRGCDTAARALLGARRSSVFLDLRRPLLDFTDYGEALAWAKSDGKGFSKQAWNILPRIAEIDRAIGPADQDRLFEAHPELAFRTLNGGTPMSYPKRHPRGSLERRRVLEQAGFRRLNAWIAGLEPRFAAPDDLLDACALAWCAERVSRGDGQRIPEGQPPRDARGLRMEIWY